MKKQNGFTLIELVVVIAILGILAAIALPKFVDLTGDARKAKMAGALGSVNSAAALIHAKWLAGGSTGTTAAYEGGTATVIATSGYPAATSIAAVAGLSSDFTVTVANGVATIVDAGKAGCQFTYTEPAASAGAVPTLSAVTGC